MSCTYIRAVSYVCEITSTCGICFMLDINKTVVRLEPDLLSSGNTPGIVPSSILIKRITQLSLEPSTRFNYPLKFGNGLLTVSNIAMDNLL